MKWVLFDAYGTLLDAGKENIPSLAAEMGYQYQLSQQEIFTEWSTKYFELEAFFKINFMTIMQANRISLAYTFGKYRLPITDVDGWIVKLIQMWSYPKLYNGVRNLMHDIISNMPKVKIGIISNTDECTISTAIKNLKLPISHIMSSERAKCYKPNPYIFRKTLGELNIKSSDCIYIGNSICDIEGATNADIKSIFLNKDRKLLPKKYSEVPIVYNIFQLRRYFLENYFGF